MKRLLIPILVAVSLVVGYFGGRYREQLSHTKIGAAKSGVELGPWRASFHVPGPGSVLIPEKNPIVRLDFSRRPIYGGYMHITITNLTARQYLVSYHVYGYDAKGRRVSDGGDEFPIGNHESVIREFMLDLNESEEKFSLYLNYGRAFGVVMSVEQ